MDPYGSREVSGGPKKQIKNAIGHGPARGGGGSRGILLYMSYIDMCGPQRVCFLAV